MNYIENLENEEEIYIPSPEESDIPPKKNNKKSSLNKNIKNLDMTPILNQKLNFYISENQNLKKQLSEIDNINLIKEKIELDEKNKTLIKENERLKNIIQDLLKLVEDYTRLRNLLDYQEKELKQYQNKAKKEKKKKYSLVDLIELREKGYSYREIAAHYKVSPSTIHYRLNKTIK